MEKEAAALALELERTKALLRWRTISPTQAASIIAELRGSGLRVTLAVDSDEPEAAKFGKAVEVVLRGAGVLTGMRRGSIGTMSRQPEGCWMRPVSGLEGKGSGWR